MYTGTKSDRGRGGTDERAALTGSIVCEPDLAYSLVHADVPLVREIILRNRGAEPQRNLDLQIELVGYGRSIPVIVPEVSIGGLTVVDPLPLLRFDPSELRRLAEAETVPLEVQVNGRSVPLEPPQRMQVLPPNAWAPARHEEALAGFVMPNTDVVSRIVARARSLLPSLLDGATGFGELADSDDPRTVEQTLAALYQAMHMQHIAYEYEPRSYAPDWQMVRFHHTILADQAGTCIDLALFFAAAIESIYRDPLIITVQMGTDASTGLQVDHALVGCWRCGSPGGGAVSQDTKTLRALVQSGEILVLDVTGFTSTREFPDGQDFSQALVRGHRMVTQYPLRTALDIIAARQVAVMPMPFGRGVQYDRSAALVLFRARRMATDLASRELTARHLLLGLLSLQQGWFRRLLARFGDRLADELAAAARASLPRGERRQRYLPETESWQAICRQAEQVAIETGRWDVREQDLLAALLETPSQVDRLLAQKGLTRFDCLKELAAVRVSGSVASEWRSSGFAEQ